MTNRLITSGIMKDVAKRKFAVALAYINSTTWAVSIDAIVTDLISKGTITEPTDEASVDTAVGIVMTEIKATITTLCA